MKNPRTTHLHPQRLAAAGVLLFVYCLLAACEAPQTTSSSPRAQAASSTAPAASSPLTSSGDAVAEENPDLGDAIKEGMSYTELRKAMGVHGWSPVSDDACMVNMIGSDHKTFCAAHPNSERCGYCSQLQGLVQCSADGHCLLVFERSSDRRRLEIGMYGELENWKYNGSDTMLGVSGWRYPLRGGD